MASHESGEGDEGNFWPGYVDTLVNMVMFMILLVVVLSVAVMYFVARVRYENLSHPPNSPQLSKQARNKLTGLEDEIPQNPNMQDMQKPVVRLKQKLNQYELRAQAEGLNTNFPTAPSSPSKGERASTSRDKDVNSHKHANVDQGSHRSGKDEAVSEVSGKAQATRAGGVENFALRPSVLIVRFKPGALDLSDAEARRFADLFVRHFDVDNKQEQKFQISTTAVTGLSESNRMAFYRLMAVRNRLLQISGVSNNDLTQRIDPVSATQASGTEALEIRIALIAP